MGQSQRLMFLAAQKEGTQVPISRADFYASPAAPPVFSSVTTLLPQLLQKRASGRSLVPQALQYSASRRFGRVLPQRSQKFLSAPMRLPQ